MGLRASHRQRSGVSDLPAHDRDGLGHPRRLWQAERPGEDPLAVVEVVNSTPEPDGTHRSYWLRVPPGLRDPRTAVAWTFGFNRQHEYVLTAES